MTKYFDATYFSELLCFLDSAEQMTAQADRVRRPGGKLVIGFIDSESAIGRKAASR